MKTSKQIHHLQELEDAIAANDREIELVTNELKQHLEYGGRQFPSLLADTFSCRKQAPQQPPSSNTKAGNAARYILRLLNAVLR